jgi:hypothetical protein
MNEYLLSHLSDAAVVESLSVSLGEERGRFARVLARLAEFDARRLYREAGYPSTRAYCVQKLRMSDDEAFHRIRAARTARKHPPIFQALAEQRIHLTSLLALAPHLNEENGAELMAAALDRTKSELERWLAGRFPKPDFPTRIEALPAPNGELVPERVDFPSNLALERVDQASGELVPERPRRPRIVPLSADRYGVKFTMRQPVLDKLRHLEALLGQRVDDLGSILELGLEARIREFEKRKYAATDRPRRVRGGAVPTARYVSAEVKRAVRERDGGRCTFVSESGHRCEERAHLEFDHIQPVARGGLATVDNLRLRCSGHNQLAAEQAFGAGFVDHKRSEARRAAANGRAARSAAAACDDVAVLPGHDVIPWLRRLGHRAEDALRGAEHCAGMTDATLEERLKEAIRFLTPAHLLPKARVTTVM